MTKSEIGVLQIINKLNMVQNIKRTNSLNSSHFFHQVLQVFGHKNGLDMLERADPLVLLIGLPAIPAGLILVLEKVFFDKLTETKV